MANVQQTVVQNPQNVVDLNSNPDRLAPVTLLLRFLHTGTTSSSIPVKPKPNLDDIENILSCINEMAEGYAQLSIAAIRKAYQTKMYVRVDNVLIALAYCAKQTHSENLRVSANTEAISLISDQSDFLLFIKYCVKISHVLRGPGHSNFGHGMCRIIEKWYEKFSPIELANMFGEHRGLHNWTHQSVIKKAHMPTKKRVISDGQAATPNVGASSVNEQTVNEPAPMSSNAVISNTQQNGASNARQASCAVSDKDDREKVFHFVFSKGTHDYLQYLDEIPEIGPGAERLKNLQKLKINENIETAVQSIQRHKFTVSQMPAHLLEKQEIWEALIPTLSTRTMLNYFNTLKDHGFLNEDTPFVRKLVSAFGNQSNLESEPICPVFMYIQKELYSKNIRYLGTKKAQFYEKKINKRQIIVNTTIELQFDNMYLHALSNATPAPAKFFVAIDLRLGNTKKAVLRNKHITCFDATFVLAYSIFKREKDALIYSFSGAANKMYSVNQLMSKVNPTAAKESLKQKLVSHTYQSLLNPIEEATKLRRKIDVFVVIVDSVARFCRQGEVPVKEFTEYRQKFNKRAKYVVINLTRPTPDLKIPQTEQMKGFFEISGFDEDTPKLLKALAMHCFT